MATEKGVGTGPGEYDHLRKTDPITVETEVNLIALTRSVEARNYGPHTLISAMIKARVERATREGWDENHPKMKMVKVLTKMLEDGIY